jgi:hypothetical protein
VNDTHVLVLQFTSAFFLIGISLFFSSARVRSFSAALTLTAPAFTADAAFAPEEACSATNVFVFLSKNNCENRDFYVEKTIRLFFTEVMMMGLVCKIYNGSSNG